jgi:ATP-binding cassette subfamily B protein
MAGRSTIMITHDLNLAPDADRILVVDRGRIVEAGCHEELLARGGAYARLHRSQNNTSMDTGELRMPLWAGVQPPAPAYEAPCAYEQSYDYGPHAAHDPASRHSGQLHKGSHY